VQKVRQEFFRDRCIYYTSSLIHELGPKGSPEWNYKLPEVYLIGIMDFGFDSTNKDKYIHEIALMDTVTKELFYDKLGYIFIEIPKFKKKITELETELDKWLFLLKNLSKLDKIPVILNKRIFSKLFKIAETATLTKEEHTMYEASLKQKWDYQNGIDYAVKTAVEMAVVETVEKEQVKAEKKLQQEKRHIAKSMKDDGFSFEAIAKYTSLSIAEIEKL
jgi:predicted transposase/invertase (TIGR01784 family)